MKRNAQYGFLTFLAVAGVVAFIIGLTHLLALRVQKGDVFAPYSSLRADPLGTKAFCESLDALPTLNVRRNLQPLSKLVGTQDTTLFFLGSGIGDPDEVPVELVQDIEKVAAAGGRVVISLMPVNWSEQRKDPELPPFMKGWMKEEDDDKRDEQDAESQQAEEDEQLKAEKESDDFSDWEGWKPPNVRGDYDEQADTNAKENEPKPPAGKEADSAAEEDGRAEEDDEDVELSGEYTEVEMDDEVDEDVEVDETGDDDDEEDGKGLLSPDAVPTVALAERWGLSYAFSKLPVDEDGAVQAAIATLQGTPGLPNGLSWHTSLYFDELDDAWRTLYARDGFPVVVERDFGPGTIVFSADSFLFSNEALLNERHPALLAWFLGENTEVVFDETHLGVAETPTVMGLARRYRLHGVIAAILVLAILFVWKNAAPFVPPHDASSANHGATLGRDAAAGFVSLLRRSIPERDLMGVCVDEWRKTFGGRAIATGKQAARIEAVAAQSAHEKHPVAAYRAVCEVLAERKGKP